MKGKNREKTAEAKGIACYQRPREKGRTERVIHGGGGAREEDEGRGRCQKPGYRERTEGGTYLQE